MDLDIDAINGSSLYLTMGIRIVQVDGEKAVTELAPTREMCWPTRDQPHGGVLFTQMDTTMATAAITGHPGVRESATIGLQIQYLAPARGAPFTCHAEVLRRGSRICFIEGRTTAADGTLVATAQGSFRTFG